MLFYEKRLKEIESGFESNELVDMSFVIYNLIPLSIGFVIIILNVIV
jgi:hypothetical protein